MYESIPSSKYFMQFSYWIRIYKLDSKEEKRSCSFLHFVFYFLRLKSNYQKILIQFKPAGASNQLGDVSRSLLHYWEACELGIKVGA